MSPLPWWPEIIRLWCRCATRCRRATTPPGAWQQAPAFRSAGRACGAPCSRVLLRRMPPGRQPSPVPPPSQVPGRCTPRVRQLWGLPLASTRVLSFTTMRQAHTKPLRLLWPWCATPIAPATTCCPVPVPPAYPFSCPQPTRRPCAAHFCCVPARVRRRNHELVLATSAARRASVATSVFPFRRGGVGRNRLAAFPHGYAQLYVPEPSAGSASSAARTAWRRLGRAASPTAAVATSLRIPLQA